MWPVPGDPSPASRRRATLGLTTPVTLSSVTALIDPVLESWRLPAPRKSNVRSLTADTTPAHERCWAKTRDDGRPGISVRDHCLNVGCVAEALVALLRTELQSLLPSGAATLAALHDVGKVSPGFQRKCERWLLREGLEDVAVAEGWCLRESDHAKISQFTVQELLPGSGPQVWGVPVGAHHGRIKGERVRVAEPWEQERRRLAAELIREFGPLPDQPPVEAALWFLAGLITVADWIGSDEKNFPQDACWGAQERREGARSALERTRWSREPVRRLGGSPNSSPKFRQLTTCRGQPSR
jgi:CRISPR-associated endonuclease Cas3-HD